MRDLSRPLNGAGAWISSMLESDQACAKELVMDIFTYALAPHGRLLWLGSLLSLVAPFGINERALRTTVFRLVGQGWLCSARSGRHSAYAIAPAALDAAGAARALAGPAPADAWDGGWTLIMAWCERLHPEAAGALRAVLTELGYRMIQPGVYGKPGGAPEVLARRCAALGVQEQVALFQGACPAGIAPGMLNARVAQLWNLEPLAARYRTLVDAAESLRQLLANGKPDEGQAYVIATLLRGWLRRIRRDDPQLPAGALPVDWPGAQADALVRQLYGQLEAPARRHVGKVLKAPLPGRTSRSSVAQAATPAPATVTVAATVRRSREHGNPISPNSP